MSDSVLLATIYQTNVLPDIMVKYILIANPQSLCNENIQQVVYENRMDMFPGGIEEVTSYITDTVSPRQILEANVSYYTSQRKTYLNLLKNYYLTDTTGNSLNYLTDLLSNETDNESKYELMFAQISKQDYDGAYTTLGNIGSNIDPEKQPEEMTRLLNMSLIIPILVNVETGEDTLENLPEYYLNAIIDLSDNYRSLAGSIATALRMRIDTNFVYNEPIYTYDDETLKMAKPIRKDHKLLSNESYLKINPNPANEYIIISYNISGTVNGLSISITDAMGKTVYAKQLNKASDEQLLLINNYAKGNYICTIFNNGKPIKSGKFIKN
ncbi:MAG: T9SS type A sorting domain-containing protein [Bacteroidota bacterium]